MYRLMDGGRIDCSAVWDGRERERGLRQGAIHFHAYSPLPPYEPGPLSSLSTHAHLLGRRQSLPDNRAGRTPTKKMGKVKHHFTTSRKVCHEALEAAEEEDGEVGGDREAM